MNDILLKMNTVSHDVLLDPLRNGVGLRGNALNCFYSYLSQQSQRVSLHGTLSNNFDLDFAVPQSSCLGPLLIVFFLRLSYLLS